MTDFEKYQKMMEKDLPKQFYFATKQTLTNLATSSRHIAQRQGTGMMVKRSRYIAKTIHFNFAKGQNVDALESSFGQLEKAFGKKSGQLSVQETGGDIKPKTGGVLRKGTKHARGGSLRKPVRKAIAKSEFMTTKKFYRKTPRARRPKTHRGHMIGMIAWAKRTKYKGLIVGRSPKSKTLGAYQIQGSGNKLKMKMMYNLESKKTTVKALKWLEASYKEPIKRRETIFKYEMDKEITKLKRINGL